MQTDYLGIIRFSDMIPVPVDEVLEFVTNNSKQRYSILLNKQYNYINKPENREIIKSKAKDLREIIIYSKYSKKKNFYKKSCCDFKLLEEMCLKYKIKT